MQVGGDDEGEESLNSAINTTPLVDVMLVLLIIFLITIPVVTHTVPVKLPEERNQPSDTKPKDIVIAVDKDGKVYWSNVLVPNNQVLLDRLKEAAVQVPQPEVHIRGDQEARYEAVGQVVFMCQRAGIVKVGFITQPPPRG